MSEVEVVQEEEVEVTAGFEVGQSDLVNLMLLAFIEEAEAEIKTFERLRTENYEERLRIANEFVSGLFDEAVKEMSAKAQPLFDTMRELGGRDLQYLPPFGGEHEGSSISFLMKLLDPSERRLYGETTFPDTLPTRVKYQPAVGCKYAGDDEYSLYYVRDDLEFLAQDISIDIPQKDAPLLAEFVELWKEQLGRNKKQRQLEYLLGENGRHLLEKKISAQLTLKLLEEVDMVDTVFRIWEDMKGKISKQMVREMKVSRE